MPLAFEQYLYEPDEAYEAFVHYRNMGPARSGIETAVQLHKNLAKVRRWMRDYDWESRAHAYSVHLDRIQREGHEASIRAHSSVWVERQQQLRQQEWDMAQKLLELARNALNKLILAGKTPSISDLHRLLELASKLGRLASGLPTDKTELTGDTENPIRIELTAALNKIYGEPLPGEAIEPEVGRAVPSTPPFSPSDGEKVVPRIAGPDEGRPLTLNHQQTTNN